MSDEQIRKIIEDSYDDSKEETLRAMAGEFYSRHMLSIALLVWGFGILFVALAAYSAIAFFQEDATRGQILYATLFIVGAHGLSLMKILAWEMMNRRAIRSDLRRMELRLADMSEMLKTR